jgi:hypothetical protein
MKKITLFWSILALAGCAPHGDRLQSDRFSGTRFLTSAETATAQAALPGLHFPLTRAETLRQLHLPAQGLASLRNTAPGGPDRERIHLTSPDGPGPHLTLVLDYDPVARTLGGDAFVAAKIIRGAEIVNDDAAAGAAR